MSAEAAPGTPHVLDLTAADLRQALAAWGEPPYRAAQVRRWLYRRLATSFQAMTDLPAALRARLAEAFDVAPPAVVAQVDSLDGSTRKALLRLADGNTVEAVLMRYGRTARGRARNTVCVSSQVGCAMGCVFCATGRQGFLRNLSPAEILAQVLHFARELASEGGRVTNVVFMGMGEPMANERAVLQAVRELNAPDGFGLAARHITVSTVGLVSGIRRLAAEPLQVGLAVSLHAPNDTLRRRLVPTAGPTSVAAILEACRDYAARTGRRVTFEYALIDRVNDTPELARELAARLQGLLCHVNLIPLNPIGDERFRRPDRGRVLAFQQELAARGIPCTVRVEKGVEIMAACGQLRGREGARSPAAARALLQPSATG
ncbi:MAG TPA: 23S rRNA (adenine(2503)-C(2))-methyltransferase RlmN [Dehalococcoidia bacterium]